MEGGVEQGQGKGDFSTSALINALSILVFTEQIRGVVPRLVVKRSQTIDLDHHVKHSSVHGRGEQDYLVSCLTCGFKSAVAGSNSSIKKKKS